MAYGSETLEDRRKVTVRPNFTYPGMEPPPEAIRRLAAPVPGTAVIPSTQPNFVRPGIDSPLQPPPAGPNPSVQDVRAKWNPANASPEARAFMAGQPAAPAVAPSVVQPSAISQMAGRTSQGLTDMTGIGSPPSGVAGKAVGALGRAGTAAMRLAGRLALPVAAGAEALDVAKVATNPSATGIDVGTQVAQGAGRLGGAAAGAGAGAALGSVVPVAGTAIGGILGGIAGYYGADKAIEAGRSAVGVSTAAPAAAMPSSIAALAAPVPRPAAAMPTIAGMSTAGASRGTVNDTMAAAPLNPAAQAMGPTLDSAINSRNGMAVQGAEGVRKFATADGRTLYSNVAGNDNNVLMSGQPGAQVIPAGDQPGAAGSMAGGAGGADLYAARLAAVNRGDIDAVKASYGGNFNDAGQATPTQGTGVIAQLQRDLAAGKRLTPAGARVILEAQQQESNAANQQATTGLAVRRLALDTQTHSHDAALKGTQVRLAGQTEAARNAVLNAKTPEEKSSAEERLTVLLGKQKETPELYSTTAINAGVDAQGNALGAGAIVTNKRTGETRTISASEARGKSVAEPPTNHVAALKKDPKLAAQFDQQYGQGAAAKYLGK